ncbi:HGGxSTG domain-containing protein [Bradyrhizobium liaoningense]|uniref:HGGxSTG domain-containing protein n=1 Tax=Bradyrhizobium liaoningense TaxID=43992 RepID=UPI003D9B00C3
MKIAGRGRHQTYVRAQADNKAYVLTPCASGLSTAYPVTPTARSGTLAKRGRTEGLKRWARSKAGREHARRNAKANQKRLRDRQRCGAKRRDGEPCTQPGMANGRCRLHGGATPRGRAWHVSQYCDVSTPAGVRRHNRKVRQQKRYATQRAARLTAMTPEQRAAFDAWHRARRPGLTKAARSAERERARQNADARRLLAEQPREAASSPEIARIRAALATAKAELARLEARSNSRDDSKGVFG